jgi:hypothetical protein
LIHEDGYEDERPGIAILKYVQTVPSCSEFGSAYAKIIARGYGGIAAEMKARGAQLSADGLLYIYRKSSPDICHRAMTEFSPSNLIGRRLFEIACERGEIGMAIQTILDCPWINLAFAMVVAVRNGLVPIIGILAEAAKGLRGGSEKMIDEVTSIACMNGCLQSLDKLLNLGGMCNCGLSLADHRKIVAEAVT